MKVCTKCKRKLDDSKFNWKKKGITRSSHCKKCSREYIRIHYRRNKPYYLRKAAERNRVVKQSANAFVASYLKTHPCVDCGENNILVLEFDHKDPSSKDGEVSVIITRSGSLKRLKEEISKCDVRCANCHRIKTARENDNWKLKYV